MMDIKAIVSLLVKDFVDEKLKKIRDEYGLAEDIMKLLERETREISLYMVKQLENSNKLEDFNKNNLEKIFKDAFSTSMKKTLDYIPENIKKENYLIQKFEESLNKGDPKALLYFVLISKLSEKKEYSQVKEVIIH